MYFSLIFYDYYYYFPYYFYVFFPYYFYIFFYYVYVRNVIFMENFFFVIRQFFFPMSINLYYLICITWFHYLLCRYRDFRNPPWDEDKYAYSEQFWHILAARMAFVVCFEVSNIHLLPGSIFHKVYNSYSLLFLSSCIWFTIMRVEQNRYCYVILTIDL